MDNYKHHRYKSNIITKGKMQNDKLKFKIFKTKKSGSLVILIVVIIMIIMMGFLIVGAAATVDENTGIQKPGQAGTSVGNNSSGTGDLGPPVLGCNNVPSYDQCSGSWSNYSYGCGDSTICSSGCGIMATTMVLKFYGKNVTPQELAQLSLDNGHRVCGSGTGHGFFPFIARKFGLQNANGISWTKAMEHLKAGHPVIVSGKGPRPFSGGGHYVVMTCYNSNGTISVNDSARADASYPEALIRANQHFLSVIY